MNNIVKEGIDRALGIVKVSLTTYQTMCKVYATAGHDELSNRTDKERYKITTLFLYSLAHPVIGNLETDDRSRAFEKLIGDLHENITEDKKLKNLIFDKIDCDALDLLETITWLWRQPDQNQSSLHIWVTGMHILYCVQNQLSSIDDNIVNNKFIERGSKCEIGKVPWAGLTFIFNDLNINIKTSISVKDKLKMGILPETKKNKKGK
jgi:hypothetical protein